MVMVDRRMWRGRKRTTRVGIVYCVKQTHFLVCYYAYSAPTHVTLRCGLSHLPGLLNLFMCLSSNTMLYQRWSRNAINNAALSVFLRRTDSTKTQQLMANIPLGRAFIEWSIRVRFRRKLINNFIYKLMMFSILYVPSNLHHRQYL